MIANVSAQGRKMVTIVDPHIKRDTGYHVHDKATKKGLYIKNTDGKDFDGWCWPESSSYLDFTSETVRSWWADQFDPKADEKAGGRDSDPAAAEKVAASAQECEDCACTNGQCVCADGWLGAHFGPLHHLPPYKYTKTYVSQHIYHLNIIFTPRDLHANLSYYFIALFGIPAALLQNCYCVVYCNEPLINWNSVTCPK